MTDSQQAASSKYWHANLRFVAVLLIVWFIFSIGAGIIFREWLDGFRIFGYPMGFWFAQQGSIYIFLMIIFLYAWRMNALDKKYGFDED